jgi:hypothetical protein
MYGKMNPYQDFHAWFVQGSTWTLCKILNRLTGSVLLYDGTPAKGRVKQGRYSLLVYGDVP